MNADFDDVGDRYEQLVEHSISFCGQTHGFYLEAKSRRLLDLVRRRLGDPADVRALDVGCGEGAMHPYLSELGALEGADPSHALIEAARRSNPQVTYHVASGENLPLADGAFDLAIAVAVLHHVEPSLRPALLAELARVTRPGGLAVVFEHNPFNPLTRLAVARCSFDEDAELLRRRDTARGLAAAGVEPVESAYILFFPWRGSVWERLEHRLGRTPFGAQYYVAAERTGDARPDE